VSKEAGWRALKNEYSNKVLYDCSYLLMTLLLPSISFPLSQSKAMNRITTLYYSPIFKTPIYIILVKHIVQNLSNATNCILSSLDVVLRINIIRSIVRSQATNENEECCEEETEDKEFSSNWSVGTKFGPFSTSLLNPRSEFLVTEFVVEHTDNCDGVAEHLEAGDDSSPDEN
jgi:hypothetical protein